MGQGRDQTRDPWIYSQTRICSQTLPTALRGLVTTIYMYINPYKPRVLFVGHRQNSAKPDQTRLIRISTVCLQKILLNFELNEKYHPATLKTEMDWTN